MKSKRYYDENDEVDAKYAAQLEREENERLTNLFAQDRLEQAETEAQQSYYERSGEDPGESQYAEWLFDEPPVFDGDF